MKMVSAIVLAAGLSTRMGEHKMLLKLSDGQGLLHRVIRQISCAQFKEVILVTGRDELAIRSEMKGFDLKIIHNENFAEGLSGSIAKGVEGVDPASRGMAICLGDMPLIASEEYDLLIEEFENGVEEDERRIITPCFAGRRGNPVIFSSHYREAIMANDYPEGCKPIVRSHLAHVQEIEMATGHVLVDVDTPSDLGRLA